MTEQNKTTTIPLPVQGKDMDSIMQSLESGVEELFTSNRYQEFLKTMAMIVIPFSPFMTCLPMDCQFL